MLVNVWTHFLVVTTGEGRDRNLLLRGQDAAQHPIMHKTVPTAKNNLAYSINSAEVETQLYHIYIKDYFYFIFWTYFS